MLQPDYSGGGLVNLMASIIQARGGTSAYLPASVLPPADLADAAHLVLLVIDGLGDDWLRRQSPTGLLARHRLGALTTVFPATTAAAITTYLTGDAPAQHGLTGWFVWLRELGAIMTVLPGRTRFGGSGYAAAGVDVGALFDHRPIFERIATASSVIAPRHIIDSDFNRAHLGGARARGFRHLEGLFRETARAIRRGPAPAYHYVYWPGLDSVGHQHGIDSPEAAAHLARIEHQLGRFMDRIAGRDALVLICADHGHIDCPAARHLDLADLPDLADCLTMPLCGEPRAAYCYVRSGQAERFEALCADRLGDAFTLVRSTDLIDRGLFGPGPINPRLAERIGDYCLLANDHYAIGQRLPFEQPHRSIGVHGGLSRDELLVPLCLLRA
jgi:hypothetical protein